MKCKLVGYEADEYVSASMRFFDLQDTASQVRGPEQPPPSTKEKKKNLIFSGIRHYNEGSFYKLNNFCLLGEW